MCRDANNSVLEAYKWSGDGIYDTISKSVLLPKECVGEFTPLTSAREAHCGIIWEQTLLQDTTAVFVSAVAQKEDRGKSPLLKYSHCWKEEGGH